MNRREFLANSYIGLGGIALSHLAGAPASLAAVGPSVNPLAPRPQQLPARAKRCIFLFMEGGASQVDLFEYKPALEKYAGQQTPKAPGAIGEVANMTAAPNRVVPPTARFSRHGQSGRWMTELLPHLATCVDDMAFIHGVKVNGNNHAPAVYHALSGNTFPGNASIGAWVTYGLGSENQDLPAFLVLSDRRGSPVIGSSAWSNGYLPAAFQGTALRPGPTPIVNLRAQEGMTREQQRRDLDLLRWLNENHAAEHSNAGELEARIASYELAYRMQIEAPELVDLSRETPATRTLYGLDDPRTESFGHECLLARRMVERGVRFVMALHGAGKGVQSWDDHGDTCGRIPKHCYEVDRPIAGLLKDLKSRGLLEETLVVWASEMGRTPFDTNVVTDKPGREHNQYGLVVWMAGGDVRAGATFGQTDDFGIRNVEDPVPLRDFHATLLHLLGLDQNRLTYLHAGRYKKLTDIGGRVITEVIA